MKTTAALTLAIISFSFIAYFIAKIAPDEVIIFLIASLIVIHAWFIRKAKS